MNGIQLCKEIRKVETSNNDRSRRKCRTLVISGDDMQNKLSDDINNKDLVDAFLKKPINSD